jgi:hypothetical protein
LIVQENPFIILITLWELDRWSCRTLSKKISKKKPQQTIWTKSSNFRTMPTSRGKREGIILNELAVLIKSKWYSYRNMLEIIAKCIITFELFCYFAIHYIIFEEKLNINDDNCSCQVFEG